MKLTFCEMKNLQFDIRPFILLIVLSIFLLAAKDCSSQERLPTLTVSGSDTLVAITSDQFNTVLFSMSYIRDIEQRNNNLSERLTKQDSILMYLNDQLTLERAKCAEQDTMMVNLETIITKTKKKARRDKFKNILLEIGLGAIIVVETVLLVDLLIK